VKLLVTGANSQVGCFAAAILEAAEGTALLPSQHVPKLRPIVTEDCPLAAPRPRNSRLAGGRLSKRFGIKLPDWMDGLDLCLREIETCGLQ
jgi:dTDP-4-dehydrorhamnose reductase